MAGHGGARHGMARQGRDAADGVRGFDSPAAALLVAWRGEAMPGGAWHGKAGI